MKARLLRKYLETKRPVVDCGDRVGVSSALVHDLICLNKKTLKVSYAMAFPRSSDSRESLKDDPELLGIFDKLEALVQSGEIHTYLEGEDDIDPRLPVYSFDSETHEIIEEWTDAYGWPNITSTGKQMYDNTHFKDRESAMRKALGDARISKKWSDEKIQELEESLERARVKSAAYTATIAKLEAELGETREGKE